MKVALGSDHAGFELKQRAVEYVRSLGHEVSDLGTHSTAAVDYPDFAEAVALAVRDQRAERGILVCGSGVSASIAANKVPGVRAGLCHDSYSAHQGVEHDDVNILVLGGRIVGEALALELIKSFLGAQFTAEERHQRRLDKVIQLERRFSR